MDEPQPGPLNLVRLVGLVLLIWTLLEVGLYWAKCTNPKHPLPVEVLPIIFRAVPALLGALVLIKARAIAEWISNTLDL